MSRTTIRVVMAAMAVCFTAVTSTAQTTTTSTQSKKFEVIGVDGNDLVVRLPEGTREIKVPDDFRFTVDGQQLAARDLKPGMKGTATITTKTTVTPVVVTEVKNGEVVQASGASLLVKTDQGFKSFTEGDVEKRGIKIVKDGVPAKFTDFHAGDRLSATIVTTHPPKVMTQQQVNATLAKAAPASGAGAGGRHRRHRVRRRARRRLPPRGRENRTPRSCRRRGAPGRCSRSPASCRWRSA